jgi:peptidoglycan/LPS O-acetylase OafA/YrhL
MARKKGRNAAAAGGAQAPIDRTAVRVDYGALEGWRGVCACLVALYHFRAQLSHPVNSHLATWPLIQHAYLFVDFFFVLSGFVIAASYQERLIGARIGVGAFLRLRLGRLYPMHLFSLFLMMALVAVFQNASNLAIRVRVAPLDARIESWLANVFLVQGLHTLPGATWNHPSWSISTEFATYVVYAFLWRFLKQRTWWASALLIVTMPVLLALLVGHIDTTYNWGILRSLLGFALGVVVFNALRGRAAMTALMARPGVATVLELVVLALVVAFVSLPDRNVVTIAAPFLFALAVACFSFGKGAVSRMFASRPLRHVGAISYSIYLLHWPLQMALMYLARWADIKFGLPWLFVTDIPRRFVVLGPTKLAGDVANVVMLAVLLGAATLTYRWIEAPWRARVRARVAGSG